MSRLTSFIVVFVCIASADTVLAIQPGKTVTWNTPMGKVVFDGKNHLDAGMKCLDCHSKIFKMKKGSTAMSMDDIKAGKFCGKCHNGKKAFAAGDPGNCEMCHQKK